MSTNVAPTITKPRAYKEYKKPRVLCPNGCGQMVSLRMDGMPHSHLRCVAKKDVMEESVDESVVEADTFVKTVFLSTPSKAANTTPDVQTTHPKIKRKLMSSQTKQFDVDIALNGMEE